MAGAVDVLVERLNGLAPKIALVLGSGLGALVEEVENAVRVPYGDLPGFPPAASPAMRVRSWPGRSPACRC